ncbi:MAG: hypothetical protein QW224_06785 [Desulfurococcaceae archaeon]
MSIRYVICAKEELKSAKPIVFTGEDFGKVMDSLKEAASLATASDLSMEIFVESVNKLKKDASTFLRARYTKLLLNSSLELTNSIDEGVGATLTKVIKFLIDYFSGLVLADSSLRAVVKATKDFSISDKFWRKGDVFSVELWMACLLYALGVIEPVHSILKELVDNYLKPLEGSRLT